MKPRLFSWNLGRERYEVFFKRAIIHTLILFYSLAICQSAIGSELAQDSKNSKEKEIFDVIVEGVRDQKSKNDSVSEMDEIKIRDTTGNIFIYFDIDNDVDDYEEEIIIDTLKFYEKIINKKFVRVPLRFLKEGLYPYIIVMIADENRLGHFYKWIEGNGEAAPKDRSRCATFKQRNDDGKIKLITMAINGSIDKDLVKNCIYEVILRSFYPSTLVKKLKGMDLNSGSPLTLADFIAMRVIYDKRTPFRIDDWEYDSKMESVIKDAARWVFKCIGDKKCGPVDNW